MPQQNAKRFPMQTSPKPFKIIVEKHKDGYVAYALGINCAVVGEGDTFAAGMADIQSAIRSHIETFGKPALRIDAPVLEAFVAETRIGP